MPAAHAPPTRYRIIADVTFVVPFHFLRRLRAGLADARRDTSRRAIALPRTMKRLLYEASKALISAANAS